MEEQEMMEMMERLLATINANHRKMMARMDAFIANMEYS
jgi:hypothetical protein